MGIASAHEKMSASTEMAIVIGMRSFRISLTDLFHWSDQPQFPRMTMPSTHQK